MSFPAAIARDSARIRVAVVEDQELYRSMLVSLLRWREDVEVVATAASVAEAREAVRATEVDVAILDIELPDGNGIGLGVQLRRTLPTIGILLLSSHDVMELLLDLPEDARDGWGYLSKGAPLLSSDVLVEAITATANGRTYLDPSALSSAHPRVGSSLANLSHRQYEVLQLVAQGLSNRGVAERLGVSPRSIENHLNAIYAVLDIPAAKNARVSAVLRLIAETTRG